MSDSLADQIATLSSLQQQLLRRKLLHDARSDELSEVAGVSVQVVEDELHAAMQQLCVDLTTDEAAGGPAAKVALSDARLTAYALGELREHEAFVGLVQDCAVTRRRVERLSGCADEIADVLAGRDDVSPATAAKPRAPESLRGPGPSEETRPHLMRLLGAVFSVVVGCMLIFGLIGSNFIERFWRRVTQAPESERVDREAEAPRVDRRVPTLTKACADDDAAACTLLATHYYRGNAVAQDQERALLLYRQACALGDSAACRYAVALYQRGEGTERNDADLAKFLASACDNGDAASCNRLGGLYYAGKGVAADKAIAAKFFRRACAQNDLEGCDSLGNLYYHGEGVPTDYALARKYYRKACDGGQMTACRDYGVTYRYGRGVKQDFAAAIALYVRACEGGSMVGCRSWGYMHEHGLGLAQDLSRALVLYRQACKGGEKESCTRIPALEADKVAEERYDAQR